MVDEPSTNVTSVNSAKRILLEQYWQAFRDRHLHLTQYEEELQACKYYKRNMYREVQQAYIEALAALSDNTSAQVIPPTPLPNTAHNISTLPKVPLARFSGRQLEWELFKKRFEARFLKVDSIDPVLKL